jgi:glycosyltransferase involved in cell wall biosynthesis
MSSVSSASGRIILFISHNMGGGVDRHISQLEGLLDGKAQAATLSSQPGNYVKLKLASDAWYFDQRTQFDDLLEMLREMQVAFLHFHHLYGFSADFWHLPKRLSLPYHLTLHDYSLINGSTTLTDREGYYVQEFTRQNDPSLAQLPAWCADLQQWQSMSAALLGSAERVFCPCAFTLGLFQAHYPDANYRHCYHPDWEIDAPYPSVEPPVASRGKLRVAVLGMLSREKGADRLDDCAIALRNNAYPIEFVLFGRAYRRLDDSVMTLGRYEEHELAELIARRSIDLVWFPALWPETYSYTLSHSLRLGLPVLAPDVGAFSERLRGRPLSFIFPYRSTARELVEQLEAIRQQLQRGGQHLTWTGQVLPSEQEFLYRRDYLAMFPGQSAVSRRQLGRFDRYLKPPSALGGAAFRTRLLRLLLSLSDTRLFVFLQRVIPYAMQKRFKRMLSDKPLHELDS